MLGLASTGVVSQLVGCSLVLLCFAAASVGLLPYPHRLLNRLHLATTGVLLAVVWLNLLVAVAEEGTGGLPGASLGQQGAAVLQAVSVALIVVMLTLLLALCAARGWRALVRLLDVDCDGVIGRKDLAAAPQQLVRCCCSCVVRQRSQKR